MGLNEHLVSQENCQSNSENILFLYNFLITSFENEFSQVCVQISLLFFVEATKGDRSSLSASIHVTLCIHLGVVQSIVTCIHVTVRFTIVTISVTLKLTIIVIAT